MEDDSHIGENIVDRLEEGKPLESVTKDSEIKREPTTEKDLEKYQKIWDAAPSASVYRKFNQGKAWSQVDGKIRIREARTRRTTNLLYAASGIAATLLIVSGLAFYLGYFSSAKNIITVATAYGSRSEVVLPDGSHVKLNAGSTLEYHYEKFSKTRRVDFNGEAFFNVSKTGSPFIIETADGLRVKVLGTKFNLRTYSEDPTVQTSLIEGSVEMSHQGAASLILKPGQIASFSKKENKLEYDEGDVLRNMGWIQNKLYMDNMSLNEVCIRLERWYDVSITLRDKGLGEKIHYTGVLKEQTVLDVLNALCRLSAIEYTLNGKKIVISGKEEPQKAK